jgi:hypothetical protein
LTTIRPKIKGASEEKRATDQGTTQEQSELQRTMADRYVAKSGQSDWAFTRIKNHMSLKTQYLSLHILDDEHSLRFQQYHTLAS